MGKPHGYLCCGPDHVRADDGHPGVVSCTSQGGTHCRYGTCRVRVHRGVPCSFTSRGNHLYLGTRHYSHFDGSEQEQDDERKNESELDHCTAPHTVSQT